MHRHASVNRALGLGVFLGAFAACTSTYLYDERRDTQVPADRTVALEGSFCTPGTNETIRPIKILLAMDASQSMRVTDPDGTRAKALIALMDALPQDDEIYLAVMVFAGSTTGWLTKSGLPQFEQLTTLDANDRLNLVQKLLNFTNPSTMPNRDSTDFVKPLSDMYEVLSRDIADTRSLSNGQTKAKYSIIFLSDGEPTNNQDDELLCGDAVRRLRQLKDLADDVRFNTVHVFLPVQPLTSVCDLSGYLPPVGGSACRLPAIPAGSCPLLLVNQNAERLSKMADLGGGDFRDFRNNEPINFLNFRFGQVRRVFSLERVMASNFSAPPGSPLLEADTDSDGLTDAQEAVEGTNTWEVDTDKDGFSDGVEVHFRELGAPFRPHQMGLPDGGGLDPGCPPALRGVDSDCDGLLDCDEQLIGTNSLRVDSDDDGVPDAVEWQMQTQPSAKDLAQDPDTDGLNNGDELLLHSDPHTVDSAKLSTVGYRYRERQDGGIDALGRQCFDFRVDNVSLANTEPDTRDAGNPDGGAPLFRRGAGFNDIYFAVSYRPGDDATGHTLVRQFRYQKARFPVGGIRAPVDGIIKIAPADLVEACGPLQAGKTNP